MTERPQLCLPLDTDANDARRLVRATAAHIDIYKVGLTTYAAGGAGLVTEIAAERPVFLDVKLHDIPAQVAGAVEQLSRLGASYLTIHASGGTEMVRAAVEAAGADLQILAVTILTSLGERDLSELGIAGPAEGAVLRLAEVAVGAGATGLVCSAREVDALRRRFGGRDQGGPLLVVPGIRMPGGDSHDQQRTASPGEAVRSGADILVVGRAITGADDPAAAAALVKKEMVAA